MQFQDTIPESYFKHIQAQNSTQFTLISNAKLIAKKNKKNSQISSCHAYE